VRMLFGVDHTWVTDGPNFGSRNVVRFINQRLQLHGIGQQGPM